MQTIGAGACAGENIMRVHEIMTEPPQTCPQGMHLADASRRMCATGCGTLIVLGPHGGVAGIVTDRNLALAMGDAPDAGRLTLAQVMSRPVQTCDPDDHVGAALDRMAAFHVRRLPVVDENGDVKGLISIDDIVLWGLRTPGVSAHAVVAALRALASASSFAAREYAETA
jgi:CBS domain-containing protein